MLPIRSTTLVLVSLSLGLRAQDLSPTRAMPEGLLVPIHTQAADPVGGEYGVWSAGATWKASFHDGFRFEPHTPQRARAPHFAWRTVALRRGAVDLPLGRGETSFDSRRHQTRFDGLREIYEVRAEGVEQLFVVERKPEGEGALVVRGAVDTDLPAEHRAPRHGALRFVDGSDGVVEYGAAIAIDAAGERVDVATSFDGEAIELQVPADFVAHARFPITIDPLTVAISAGAYNFQIFANDWTSNMLAGSTTAMVGVIAQHSAGDLDLLAWSSDESSGLGTVFYSDITTSWSTTTVDSVDMPIAGKWLIGFERDFPSNSSTACRVQVVDDVTAPTPGTTLFLPAGTTTPRVGGRRSGSTGVVVCLTGTGCSATLVDAATPALGVVQNVAGNFTKVAVSRSAATTTPWCFLAQINNGSTFVYHLADTGSMVGSGVISAPAGAGSLEIDGDDTRFLATWTELVSVISQRHLMAQRVDWTGISPTLGTPQVVASVTALTNLAGGKVAHDFTTRSHWAVTWTTSTALSSTRTARIARLGYHGAVVETGIVFATSASNDPVLPVVAFDGDHSSAVAPSFSVSYVDFQAAYTVMHERFDYSPNALIAGFGSSCASNTFSNRLQPYAGSEFYTVTARGLPANSTAFVIVGLAPTSVPLDPIGMTGCTLLVDPIIVAPSVTDRAGGSTFAIGLNDDPLFTGDLYLQWLWPAPGANPFGMRDGQGLRVQVR